MTNSFERLLAGEETILLDGAMGTMLMEAGLAQGDPPEGWNIHHQDRLRLIHRSYIEAGARIILTNSFGGTRYRLQLHGLQDQVAVLNQAAAVAARAEADVAPDLVVVAGSIGPTGELVVPLGEMTFEQARAAFAEQAAALAAGGVDLLWIETMSDLAEVRAAVAGAQEVCDLPIAVTMTFDTRGNTMMGITPQQAVTALGQMGLAAMGANCGNGLAQIEGVIAAMAQANPALPLIAKSNAGIPQWVGNELIYDGTPEIMAGYAERVRGLGARLIGGCCGSTPAHIRAMAAALTRPVLVMEVEPAPSAEADVADGRSRRQQRRRRHRHEG